MTTEDDIKRDVDTAEPSDPEGSEGADGEGSSEGGHGEAASSAIVTRASGEGPDGLETASPKESEDEGELYGTPAQLGGQRFVYAAYFAGGIAVAFILSKAISYGWTRLNLWKPEVGEPHDEIVMPVAALVGALTAFYYYRDEKTRTLAEEVASELGKVSWPTRDEVVNSTFVVVITTFVATAFFALMDRFWGFVTNLVYGA
jgi:preprotein translocase subunit SecE